MRNLIFRLASAHYALPLGAVREVVVPPTVWSKVPRAPASVHGVMNLRGRVITVIRLSQLLGIDTDAPNLKIVLLDRARRDLGLMVSEVEGIESIERISPAPHPTSASRGAARVNGISVTILDAELIESAVISSFVSRG
jgi:purine-binding chemotaxis protein CheW